MKTIWKYPLEVADRQIVRMPTGAEILCVQAQHGMACLWAIVDPDAPRESRIIDVFGTGHRFHEPITGSRYIGTFQVAGGSLVFHVFDATPPPAPDAPAPGEAPR